MKKNRSMPWYQWIAIGSLLGLVVATPARAAIVFGDVELVKTVDKQTASEGDTVTFTLTVKNNHESVTATNVKVEDAIPLDLEFISSSAPTAINNLVLVWETAALGPGASASVTVTTKVKPDADEEIKNCAAMTSTGFVDTAVGNNFACASFDVTEDSPPPPAPTPAPTPTPSVTPTPTPTPSPTPTPAPPPPGGPGGSISGSVVNDANNNGKFDEGEVELSGWTVYLDHNNNGSKDSGEPQDVTESPYLFTGLADGTYFIKQIIEPGWSQTYPDGGYTVTISGGNAVTGKDFGNHRNTSGGGGGGGSSGGGGSTPPPAQAPPPSGGPGQVLGDTTTAPTPTPASVPTPTPTPTPRILGSTTQLPRTGNTLPFSVILPMLIPLAAVFRRKQ